jgi:prepilin-type N-terminal cleavage/methylation domain-containing protein
MRHAFSLVELSIVLVILGLLTGGILAGQSLIRAAELRAVSTEYSRYLIATQTFRDKYFGLPGDLTNATAFWGALDGNNGILSDCRGETTSILTCNGDGNGRLEDNAVSLALTNEQFLIWKHLANAGLIEGSYSSSPAESGKTLCPYGSGSAVGNCNTPGSKLSNGMWNTTWRGQLSGDPNLFDGEYGNILVLTLTPSWNANFSSMVKAEELWNIDTKLDDGKPASGRIVAGRWGPCTSGAANTADGANASYRLSTSDLRCAPVFRNVF